MKHVIDDCHSARKVHSRSLSVSGIGWLRVSGRVRLSRPAPVASPPIISIGTPSL